MKLMATLKTEDTFHNKLFNIPLEKVTYNYAVSSYYECFSKLCFPHMNAIFMYSVKCTFFVGDM